MSDDPADKVRATGSLESGHTLFHAIANFTYDWETWMGVDGLPRWVNPAVERISGYSPDECMRMEDYPLPMVHPDDRVAIAACLEKAQRGESGNDVEFRIAHKTGDERWGAVSWQTITDDQGEAIGYRTSVRDITGRKHTEQALRRAQQVAEKASADKSQFLAAASHDLRQPIQAANMFAGALQSSSDIAENERIVTSLQSALDAAGELLDALLDVSRLDSGVMSVKHEAVYLSDIFEEIETEFAGLTVEKNLELRVIATSQLIAGDFVMLLRVVRNLVSNAIRYTESGRVLVGARRHGTDVRVEVWDTGIGIADEDLGIVFDDFRQLGNTERDRRKGLGLGLSIVRRAADLLGVSVSVRSEIGKGSVFAVTGSREVRSIDQKAAPVAYEDIDLRGRVVLCIDDDAMQLEALGMLFGQWDMHVLSAVSGTSACEALDASTKVPDLVIADFRLREGETGVDAIRAVSRRLGKPVPAIVLTGDTEPARIAEAAASGHGLLHKPVSPSVLRQAINDVLV